MTAHTAAGVVFCLVGLLVLMVVPRLSRRSIPEDFLADPVSGVDWDNALEWLLYDEGVHVEPVRLPASDEDLLDLADVVGVRSHKDLAGGAP